MFKKIIIYNLLILFFAGCEENGSEQSEKGDAKMNITVTSEAFHEGQMIPSKYTCDDKNISPAINWDNIPKGTKSIALISDDPDAPMGTWVHWVVYNITPESIGLPENFPPDETLPNGIRQGITSFGNTGYGGPCPPSGTHRYYFKVYALDAVIDIVTIMDKEKLLEQMKDHILARGQLMGRYKRK